MNVYRKDEEMKTRDGGQGDAGWMEEGDDRLRKQGAFILAPVIHFFFQHPSFSPSPSLSLPPSVSLSTPLHKEVNDF